MKKNNLIWVVGWIVVLLVLVGIFFMSEKDMDTGEIKKLSVDDSLNDITAIVSNNLTWWLEVEEEIEQTSEEIAEEMETLIDSFESNIIKYEWEEGQLYKWLQENYFDNYTKKVDINNMKEYIEKDNNISKQLEITIFDFEAQKPIEWADVYLWGFWLGKTDKDGSLNREIKLPISLSFHYIYVEKRWYIWWYKYIDNILKNKETINQYIELKKNISKQWEHNNINIINDDFKISLTGECNFKTNKWKCYVWKVNIDVWYLSASDISALWFPMRSIPTNGNNNVFDLITAGMDFTDFYDEDWNKLTYTKKNRIKICHYISSKDQKDVEEIVKPIKASWLEPSYDDIWNYRWFDKSKWIWIAGVDAIKTIDWDYQCYQTFNP